MANSDILSSPGVVPSAAPSRPAAPRKKPAPPPQRSASILDRIEREPGNWKRDLIQFLQVSTVSLIIHAALFAVMWFTVMPETVKEEILAVLVENEDELATEEEVRIEQVEMPEELETTEELDQQPAEIDAAAVAELDQNLNVDFSDAAELQMPEVELGDFGKSLSLENIGDIAAGRSQAGQKVLMREFGGTEASQASVNSGLRWLAEVQREDGSWSFTELGESGNPGTLDECYTGATGLALLCYLGAGHTHEKNDEGKFSPYRDNVAKGINFLLKSAKLTPEGADLRGVVKANEGMYVQGICAMALCEAHALTKDRRLRQVAQAACQFIVNAQDPKGGGWRYKPRDPGDTSVVGWQLMSLLSARSAKIPIPQSTLKGVNVFLDSVQVDGGAQYGYTGTEPNRPGTTSIGLLARMLLGWKPDNEALQRGMAYLAKTGPSPGDIYYNYYATQAIFTYATAFPKDSPEYALWTNWNERCRDMLVMTQTKEGPGRGSWKPAGGHAGDTGGRLFQTCLSIMTLEVYYRKLPIYDRKRIQVDL